MAPLVVELPPQVGLEKIEAPEWLERLDQMPIEPKALGAATPPEFLLGSLRDGRLRVVEPIAVLHTTENDEVVLEARELNEFGFGDNVSEAVADLQTAIAELYFTLNAEEEHLGPDLAVVRETLTRKLRMADVYLRS